MSAHPAPRPRLPKTHHMQRIGDLAGFRYDPGEDTTSPRRFRRHEVGMILKTLRGEWPVDDLGLRPTHYEIMAAVAAEVGFAFDADPQRPRGYYKSEIRAIHLALTEGR